jgi:hypothetical protein
MSDDSRQRAARAAWALGLAAALAAVPAWSAPPAASPAPAGKGAPAAPTPTPAATSIRFAPQARKMSTYTLSARYEITTSDVTFEAPPAYIDGFNFWAGRMKGQRRSEVYQMQTMTQETGASGMMPFRRTVPRFNLEFEKQGQVYASAGSVERDVVTLVWEGTLDAFGNLKDKRKVAGKDNADMALLAIDEIDRVFPVVEGARDLKIGEGFKEERIMPLPTKLSIAGLDALTLKITREFTLKSIEGGLATFDVKVTYGADPAFKPTAEHTTCAISGGGTGGATFEIPRGVFLWLKVPSSLHIDIEAPLRPLPGHPETEVASEGKSHIELAISLFGQQTVVRSWGDEDK